MPNWLDRLTGTDERIVQLETSLKEAQRLLEQTSALMQMYDPDSALTAAQGGGPGFRRLTQSPRDFSPLQHQKSLKLAFWLYETNPVARRILATTSAYLVGDGFTVNSDDQAEKQRDAVQEIIDQFWQDHVNLMDLNLPKYALELGMWGELCLTINVNPVDGLVRLGSVDPENIIAVVMNAKGSEVEALELAPAGGSIGGKRERLKVITVDEDPNSDSYGLLMGAGDGETWQERDAKGDPAGEPKPYIGSCFFFRVNNVSNARRGRSDLLSVIDWLDAYDQQLFNELERSELLKAFIWDVQLEGKNEAEIRAWLKDNGAPKPGAVRAHNEAVTWTAVTPDLKTADSATLAEVILGHIATGAQYPKTWLNVTEDVNKASGQVLDEPTFRWMSARQMYLRYIVEQIVIFQLDQAQLAGKITRPKQAGTVRLEAWNLSIDTPELRVKDLHAGAQSFQFAIQGLATAVTEHFIDLETAQKTAVLLIEQLGIDVDLEEMQIHIEEEIQKQAEMMPPPVIPPTGTPGTPGASPAGQGTTPPRQATPGPAQSRRPRLAPPEGLSA